MGRKVWPILQGTCFHACRGRVCGREQKKKSRVPNSGPPYPLLLSFLGFKDGKTPEEVSGGANPSPKFSPPPKRGVEPLLPHPSRPVTIPHSPGPGSGGSALTRTGGAGSSSDPESDADSVAGAFFFLLRGGGEAASRLTAPGPSCRGPGAATVCLFYSERKILVVWILDQPPSLFKSKLEKGKGVQSQ